MENIKIKLNLASFKHAKISMKGKEGKQVKGIFIPFEVNNLFVSEKGGVYFDAIAFQLKQPKDWATHLIKQSFSKDERQKMTEEEIRNLPIFGNLILETYTPTETNNEMDIPTPEIQDISVEDDDDLPF